jgi:hypothetical protein
MSFQAMTWAIGQKTTNAGQKLVLLMLANHSNSHTGQCNPSHKLLAEECSMGLSTLKGHIAALEEAGYLRIIHKAIEGVSLPNQYHLNLGGVGQNLAEGQSESDRGVGQNLASNQEDKPINKPFNTREVTPRFALPDWVPVEAWREFESMRQGIKKPMTPFAAQLIIKKMDKFRQEGHDVQKVLEQSIVNSWQDIYEPKPQKQQPRGSFETQGDRNAKVIRGLTRGLLGSGNNVKLLGN